ncbi:MAG TPA: tetratricopeptide repeat protein [Polyangia bacterium]|nr:tetratricopeptide repeat protein [Polyangia bacterium]
MDTRLVALALAIVVAATGAAEAKRSGDPPRAAAVRALRTGDYEGALRIATAAKRAPAADRLDLLAARARVALGRYAEARAGLEATLATSPDDLPARDALMRLLALVGDRTALAPLLARSYDDWNAGRVDRKNAAALVAIATAARLDGNWKDANETLRDAVRADARATAANLDWGWMFLEKHAADEAEASFRAVLAVDADEPDAHVGLARALLDRRYDVAAARAELARALAINPRHPGALALRAELALDREDRAAAAADVAALRATNPVDPGAARVAAAAAMLGDDEATFRRERDADLAAHVGDADLFAFVAEVLVRQRRYDEAGAVAEAGAALDPTCARCLSAEATTLLRLGDEARGLEALRRAWKLDPYDARTFNLLDLYEKVIPARYVTLATAHLRFRVEPATRAAIEEVVGPFLEETYARDVARYGFEPKGPITFELYGDPSHFAIRTVGLPTIGVSAVCFGRVITSQAPTNHAFNWGMVLAHELAHVFAIELSRSRVPRWFTEGLSEVETMRQRPEWARHDDVALWGAARRGELHPLASLSDAFLDARDADAAVAAYAQAALAVDFFERRFGFAKIRAALVAFGRGAREGAALEGLAGMPATALEKAFRAELDSRFARYDAQWVPTERLRLPVDVATGLAALQHGDEAAARAALARARAAASKSAADRAAEAFLAGELALAHREADAATSAFTGVLAESTSSRSFDGYDVRVRLALAEIHRGDRAAAEAHLRRAIAFDDARVEPHALLAEMFADEGRDADRAAELEAALRLEPQSAARAKELVLGSARAGRSARVLWAAPVATFIDPADGDVFAAYGRALAATGQPAAAVKQLERALLFHPTDAAAVHRGLADLYAKLGDRARAEAHRAAGAP